jgi:hypothetical protein
VICLARNRKFQNFVGTVQLASQSVNASDIADNAIASQHIGPSAITNDALSVHQIHSKKLTYDVIAHGGDETQPFIEVGVAPGEAAPSLPVNAVIVNAYVEVITALNSPGSATISIGVQSDDDALLAATAFNNGMFVENKVTAVSNTLPLKLVGEEPVIVRVQTAALVAGKFNIFVEYYLGA